MACRIWETGGLIERQRIFVSTGVLGNGASGGSLGGVCPEFWGCGVPGTLGQTGYQASMDLSEAVGAPRKGIREAGDLKTVLKESEDAGFDRGTRSIVPESLVYRVGVLRGL